MRRLLFFCGYMLIFLLWSLVAIFSFPFVPLKRRTLLCYHAYKVFEVWLSLCAGIRVVYDYAATLPKDTNYIIVANHQSIWDAFALTVLRRPSVTVLKEELMRIPIGGLALRTIDPIVLRRKNLVQSMRRIHTQGMARLRQGYNLVIFPQGTRVSPPALGAFSPAAVRLALASGKAILPIAHNSGELLSSIGALKRSGCLRVKIGPPMYFKPTTNRAEQQAAHKQVIARLVSMMREVHTGALADKI